jgi:peptidoglycan/xylan/chitin deacetylase (PgdA/CDA1 family)
MGFVNPWLIATPVALTAAAVTAYGAANPRSALFGPTVWRTTSPRKLAITFDDGPNPKITPEILQLLDRYEARVTFFMVGRFAQECPELVREIIVRGHAIGNHTATHVNLFWNTPSQIKQQMQRCNEAIGTITGMTPKWFRPPWGLRNPWVVSNAMGLSMRTVLWTLLPGDWRAKPASWLIERMEPIANRTQSASVPGNNVQAAHGDVLCLHDGDYRFLNADRRATVEALQYWLPRWRDLGLEFVTIDEAVSLPAR